MTCATECAAAEGKTQTESPTFIRQRADYPRVYGEFSRYSVEREGGRARAARAFVPAERLPVSRGLHGGIPPPPLPGGRNSSVYKRKSAIERRSGTRNGRVAEASENFSQLPNFAVKRLRETRSRGAAPDRFVRFTISSRGSGGIMGRASPLPPAPASTEGHRVEPYFLPCF